MLKHLLIRDYILIDRVEIDFSSGFNVITGETGSGKSIILNAVSFLLGVRSDVSVILQDKERCVVEGIFISGEAETIIRRELSKNGRSRYFYNDSPALLSEYKILTRGFLNIHSQQETLLLDEADYQQKIVDSFAHNEVPLNDYVEYYHKWLSLKSQLADMQAEYQTFLKDKDYISFQYRQIEELNLREGEVNELEEQAFKLRNSEELKQEAFSCLQILYNDDKSVVSLLNRCKLNKVSPSLSDRLKAVEIEVSDIVEELHKVLDSIENDPSKLQVIEDRLTAIHTQLHKHNVKTTEELLSIQDDYKQQMQFVSDYDDKLEALNKSIKECESSLCRLAKTISERRRTVCGEIEKKLVGMLKQLGIMNAKVKIDISALDTFSSTGCDQIQILFSANLNQGLKNIAEVASGGEKSRLMLCIKSMIADIDDTQTVIFDEIDSGVSGQVAMEMASLMKSIAVSRQVISVTHLPQIAAQGEVHFKVFKKDSKGFTRTYIEPLSSEERVIEVATMLSGIPPGREAIENAKRLIGG